MSRGHLVPKQIVNVDGHVTTVYVRPDDAGWTPTSVPGASPASAAAADYRQVIDGMPEIEMVVNLDDGAAYIGSDYGDHDLAVLVGDDGAEVYLQRHVADPDRPAEPSIGYPGAGTVLTWASSIQDLHWERPAVRVHGEGVSVESDLEEGAARADDLIVQFSRTDEGRAWLEEQTR